MCATATHYQPPRFGAKTESHPLIVSLLHLYHNRTLFPSLPLETPCVTKVANVILLIEAADKTAKMALHPARYN